MSEEVYFRSSSFGNLMTESKGVFLTESQAKELKDFDERIRQGLKPLTEPQRKKYDELKSKRDAPPQLSDSAKGEIEKIWRLNKKGYYEELNNKFVSKGLLNEQEGLTIVSDYLQDFLIKNDERKYKNNITGEADAFSLVDGKKIVLDIKCSWDPKTFMNGKLSKIYEFQLRCYMMLYDVEEAWLCYCLTDASEDAVADAKRKEFYKYFHNGMSNEEVELLEQKLERVYKQIETNMIYSNNPAYKKEEMVKIYKIARDKKIEQAMIDKIKPALEYYNSIKLNQK